MSGVRNVWDLNSCDIVASALRLVVRGTKQTSWAAAQKQVHHNVNWLHLVEGLELVCFHRRLILT
eukprot:5160271-Amphidinium_carterae.2